MTGRREDVPDEDYYARIAQNPTARAIKLIDVADNADEARLSLLPPEEADRLRRRYAKARRLLGVADEASSSAVR